MHFPVARAIVAKEIINVKNITILERNLDVNGTDTLTSFVLSALHKNKIMCKTYSGCFGCFGCNNCCTYNSCSNQYLV